MEILWKDVRYATRRLLGEPGFTAVAVLTLALGIGLNSAIFSLIDGMLLRAVPYPAADRLVFLTEWSEQVPNMSFSVADFEDLRDQSRDFESLGAVRGTDYTLTGDGEAERLDGRQVSAGFLPALGIRPLIGREIRADDDRPGADRVAVLGEGFWKRRFGRDPGVLGRSLTLDGESYTVVGVVPARFHGSWKRVDVFTSLLRLENDLGGEKNRGNHPGIYVVGRLEPGVTIDRARVEVVALAERLAAEYPKSNARQSMTVAPIAEVVTGRSRPALLVLLGAVGLVLLIACGNVANLLLARGAARQRELAVRAALGASRRRVVRQLLTESLLLALVGGALGVLVAWAGMRGLLALVPASAPGVENVSLDEGVLLFTAALSLGTGLLFGVAPAWSVSRLDPHEVLREGGRSLVGGGHQRLRQALVVAEVSLSLVLLVGAGLLIRSFLRVVQASPGFEPAGVITAEVSLPEASYAEPEKVRQFIRQTLDGVAALPGVQSSGSALPLLGGWQTSFRIEGRPEPPPGQRPSTDITRVSPGYFSAMGVRLLKGRLFDDRDRASTTPVCLVDETFAAAHWPGQDPIGQRINLGGKDDTWVEIVGVVNHVKNYGVDQDSRVETYLPYTQSPRRSFTFVVRTSGTAVGIVDGIRSAVRAVDPTVPVFDASTLDDQLADSRAPRRVAALLTGSFAALALLLAAVGIYGVVSYSVTRRTSEIGIRLALGADPSHILRLVVGRGLALAGGGIVLGLVVALALSRLVSALLFQVSPMDPPTFSLTPVLLAATALVACYLPARRAMGVDPSVALREE
jgi:putative ABC transport system permease protein